jgi:hypothetical protein
MEQNQSWTLYLRAAQNLQRQGDYKQAEKILKSGLGNLEKCLLEAKQAEAEMLLSLLELYSAQGQVEEVQALEARLGKTPTCERVRRNS